LCSCNKCHGQRIQRNSCSLKAIPHSNCYIRSLPRSCPACITQAWQLLKSFMLLSSMFSLFPLKAKSSARTQAEALLQWKSTLSFSPPPLSSWSRSNLNNLCKWTAVSCSSTSRTVSQTNLRSLNITGTLAHSTSPHLLVSPRLTSRVTKSMERYHQPLAASPSSLTWTSVPTSSRAAYLWRYLS